MIGVALMYICLVVADCVLMGASVWLYGWLNWSFWWIVFAAVLSIGNVRCANEFIEKAIKHSKELP